MDQSVSEPNKTNSWFVFGLLSIVGCAAVFSICVCAWTVFAFTRIDSNFTATAVPTTDIVKNISADPGWELYLNEEFSNNANHWSVEEYQSDNITLERKIQTGKYIWNFNAKEAWNFWEYPSIKFLSDFVVVADINHVAGSPEDEYGLTFRGVGDNNYIFFISERGYFSFVLRYADNWNWLIEDKSTSAIQPGSNRIGVKAIGSHFTFYINDQEVGNAQDDRLKYGAVGILMAPEASLPEQSNSEFSTVYEAERFRVWIPVEDENQTATSPATLPLLTPEKGRLIYSSDRDGNLEIYSSASDGSDTDRLTNNPADDYAATWSPDGQQVAFISTRGGNPDLYIMDADGSDMTRITDTTAEEADPDWSVDGKKIAFIANRTGKNEIFVYSVNDKSFEQITDDGVDKRFPTWSSVGDQIMFQSDGMTSNIYIIDLKTKRTIQKTFANNHQIMPVWSADGKFLLLVDQLDIDQGSLVVRNMTVSGHTEITDSAFDNKWPNWSPTGEQIVFVSNRNGHYDIFLTDREGKKIFQVTDDAAIESYVDWIE